MKLFTIDPLSMILWSSLIITGVIIISLLFRGRLTKKEKVFFFILIAAPALITTFYLAGYTINNNIVSVTKGPVHWHMDYQVWVCGERLNLVDPKGMENKIGDHLLHEHNDGRVHVEGVVTSYDDVSLGNYFYTIGGKLSNDQLIYPTDDGVVEVANGQFCDQLKSTLKVYVNGKAINNPQDFVMYPAPNVPPGDCVIIEFSPGNELTTNRTCDSWDAKGWNYDNYISLREDE